MNNHRLYESSPDLEEWKELDAKCNSMKEETNNLRRRAEINNILQIIRTSIYFASEGIEIDMVETIKNIEIRVQALLNNEASAGLHDNL
jgi:hypothetical protein